MPRVTRRRIVAGAFVLLCLVAAYLFLARQSAERFSTAYAAYAALAKTQEAAAYLPAAPNNPVRQQLNLVLSQTLQTNISSAKRLADARLGLDLLAQLETEVDAIGSTSDKANTALAALQVGFTGGFLGSPAHELIDLAKQRSSFIEDIRGLSYRADFDTQKIFDRIIADHGALTAAHITALNDEVPQVETEFNRRTSLYAQLEQVSAEISRIAATLGPPGAG